MSHRLQSLLIISGILELRLYSSYLIWTARITLELTDKPADRMTAEEVEVEV